MNVRQKKLLIVCTAGLIALSAVALLIAAFILPVGVASPEPVGDVPAVTARATPADTSSQRSTPTLAELQQLSAMNLRRPLFDSTDAAGPSGPAQPVPSSLTVKLVGTVNEPGHSMAMLQKRDGTIALCAQGQTLDDAGSLIIVTRIDFQKVLVRFADQIHELVVMPQP